MHNKIMTIDNQLENEKLQCAINREAEKMSALPSSKTNHYEELTGREILQSNEKKNRAS